MITLLQYFGSKSHPRAHDANATTLLAQVNLCLDKAKQDGCYDDWIDPDTNSQISGSKGGAGDGGYRTPDSKTGAPSSSHREGKGVDVYDPENKLDDWITDELLKKCGLYREHPDHTKGWVHLTTRPPRSGTRSFHI